MLVDFVNQFIIEYCNTNFSTTVATDVRCSASTPNTVLLPTAPVHSIEALYTISDSGEKTLVAPEDYFLDSKAGLVNITNFKVAVSMRTWGISVDYTYGHLDIPTPVSLAALELVTHYKKREFNSSKTINTGESISFPKPTPLPMHIASLLDMYKVL